MNKLWSYFRGYIIIRIEGLSLEKFINYAIARGIFLWDIIRLDYTTMEAKTELRSYRKLRGVTKRSGCRVKIYEKIGYPFFMRKIKTRKMLIFGAIISLVLIFTASSFVWDIEILGVDRISRRAIESYLHEYGLFIGAFKYQLDLENIENRMMIQMDQLVWIGIEIKGTKAVIQIVEKGSAPEKIPIDKPCHIVATKNGVIEKVIAKNGNAAVEKGSIVKAGQILISGIITHDELTSRYVHALGEVYAKTYYEEKEKMDFVILRKIKTGNKFKRRRIEFGDNQLSLSIGEIPFTNFITETKKRQLKWRNIELPVEIITEEYY
ncbi:MAG: sporulation protein YqfD, partial [Thermotaleaceae bacterium]